MGATARRSADGIYVAVDGAVAQVDGRPYVIRRGMTVRAGHPLLDGREELFEPWTPDLDWPE